MEAEILEALNEMKGQAYSSLEEARPNYSPRELLDIWLRYEGIIGYTDTILNVMTAVGFPLDIADDDFLEM
jgi:hypothetical protein